MLTEARRMVTVLDRMAKNLLLAGPRQKGLTKQGQENE